jgi:hypothetical protein
MECPESDALFECFVQATENHVVATDRLVNLIGARERFAEARLRVAETHADCKAAQSAFEAHREQHKCCAAPSPEEANPADERSVAGR